MDVLVQAIPAMADSWSEIVKLLLAIFKLFGW